jgi:hypothetical protein
MPVPTSLSDLKTTANANSPQGTESAKGTIDDYFRAHASFIAQLNALIAGSTVTLASSGTVAIGAAASQNVAITGTSTITAFDTVAEGVIRWVAFSGALTLTHNAASLILPGAANITTAAGDVAVFKSLGSGNWKCMSYQPAAGYLAAAAIQNYLPKAGGTLSGPLILAEGNVTNPGLTFANDGGNNTGLCHLGDDVIGVVCGGTLIARISSTGGFEAVKITQKALP